VSIYACDVHGARIRGPLDAIYLTLLQSGDRLGRRLRVCPKDHEVVLAEWSREWTLVDSEGVVDDQLLCSACSQPAQRASDLSAFFATSYRKGSEPEEYYAAYCGACAPDVASRLGLKPS